MRAMNGISRRSRAAAMLITQVITATKRIIICLALPEYSTRYRPGAKLAPGSAAPSGISLFFRKARNW